MCDTDTDLDLDLEFAEDEQLQDPIGEYAGVAWGLAETTVEAGADPAKAS